VPVLLVGVALLGLAIGSFLNVVVYRVPAGLSLASPPSSCPSCQTPIRNRHNVPVLGWLMLKGRCHDCRNPISPQYPLMELTCGVLFVAVALRMAHLHRLLALPAFLYFAAAGLALSVIDVRIHRLPNKIVLPSYPILAILLVAPALIQQDWPALVRTLAGAASLYVWYLTLALIYPSGMGFGDVKLAGLVGGLLGYLSWSALLVGAFAAFAIGGIAGMAVMASRRGGRKTAIPFGPFMILGALAALFAAQPLSAGYLNLIGA
jgi:leader peptidase (prepilin peptidase) / N-methyltransferase